MRFAKRPRESHCADALLRSTQTTWGTFVSGKISANSTQYERADHLEGVLSTRGGQEPRISCWRQPRVLNTFLRVAATLVVRENIEGGGSATSEFHRNANQYSGGVPMVDSNLPPEFADQSGSESLDAAGLEVFEIAGTIKWFDASKGYGFIVPDNGLPDVLLHVTCLRAGGHQTAYEGARVHCQVLRRPKGMQAFRILSMDESTAIHPSQLPQRTHVIVQPESDWERAMVKWFNRIRGFGFLTRGEGTEDIFVHMESLRRFGFTELRPGQVVQVRWGRGSKGCMAAELRPDGVASGLPSSH